MHWDDENQFANRLGAVDTFWGWLAVPGYIAALAVWSPEGEPELAPDPWDKFWFVAPVS
jgi:hypothetical protein